MHGQSYEIRADVEKYLDWIRTKIAKSSMRELSFKMERNCYKIEMTVTQKMNIEIWEGDISKHVAKWKQNRKKR